MERIQKDAVDQVNHDIRLVYEKSDGFNPSADSTGTISAVHYWIEGMRVDFYPVNAKSALELYAALKTVRDVRVEINTPEVKTTIEEEQVG